MRSVICIFCKLGVHWISLFVIVCFSARRFSAVAFLCYVRHVARNKMID